MAATVRTSLRYVQRILLGPAAIGLLTLLFLFLRSIGLNIPNPGLPMLVLVALLTFSGDWTPNILNTLLGMGATLFLYMRMDRLSFHEEGLARLLVTLISFPAGTLVVFIVRRRLERALAVPAQAEYQFFQAVMASMHDAIVETDWKGIRDVNTSFCRMTGFSRAELIGATAPFPFWPVEQYARIAAALETSMRGQALDFELVLTRKDGERFPVLLSVSRIVDSSNSQNRVLYSFREITELKRAQEQLEESNRRLQTAVDAARMGTWDFDLRTQHVAWAGYHEQLWGMAPGEFNGTLEHAATRLHPEDKDFFTIANKEYLDGRVSEREFRIIWPDGSIHWMAATGAATFDEKGEPIRFSGVVRDVTERRQSEMLLAGQRQILEQIARGTRLDETLHALVRTMESLMPDTLCSLLTITSDRNHLHVAAAPSLPPAIISKLEGFAIGPGRGSCGSAAFTGKRVVSKDLQADPSWGSYWELVAQHHLAACTAEPVLAGDGRVLGTFGVYFRTPREPDAGQLRIFELAANLAAIAIERDREERELRDAKEAAEIANRTKDRFLHLLSHELRSPLTPILTLASVLESDSRLPEDLRADMVIIRRNAEVEARLVDELLELVRIAKHPLSVESDAPGSSREHPRSSAAAPHDTGEPGRKRQALRILVVEDHTDTRLILSRTLSRRGHTVAAAANVADAMSLAKSQPFDFLLSDIGLPDGSGLDLIRRIHALRPEKPLPAIALSGFGSDEDIRRSLDAGFHLHLVKPINFNTLLDAIERFSG